MKQVFQYIETSVSMWTERFYVTGKAILGRDVPESYQAFAVARMLYHLEFFQSKEKED